MLLQFGAGVGSDAMFVQTSFVTDCNRAVVVAYGMNALNTFGQNGNNVAIALHKIVIGWLSEALVAGVDQTGNCKRLVATRT